MDERREQLSRASATRAQWDRGRGLVLIRLGAALIVIPCLVVIVLWYTNVLRWDGTGAVLPWFLIATLWLVTKGRRIRARGGERALAEDARAPIVYLRPFNADGAQIAT